MYVLLGFEDTASLKASTTFSWFYSCSAPTSALIPETWGECLIKTSHWRQSTPKCLILFTLSSCGSLLKLPSTERRSFSEESWATHCPLCVPFVSQTLYSTCPEKIWDFFFHLVNRHCDFSLARLFSDLHCCQQAKPTSSAKITKMDTEDIWSEDHQDCRGLMSMD